MLNGDLNENGKKNRSKSPGGHDHDAIYRIGRNLPSPYRPLQGSPIPRANSLKLPWQRLQRSKQINHGLYCRRGSRIFLGGGAVVSCSAPTPINHIVFCVCAEYQLYKKTAGHLRGVGGASPAPSPQIRPCSALPGGRVLPIMAYVERFRPTGGPFSGFRYTKGQGNLSFWSVKGPKKANR